MSRTRDEAMSLLDKFSTYAQSNPGGAQVIMSAMKRELIRIQLGQLTAKTMAKGMKARVATKFGAGIVAPTSAKPAGRRGRPAGSKNKPKATGSPNLSGVDTRQPEMAAVGESV